MKYSTLVTALIARLETITVEHGYNTNIGNAVTANPTADAIVSDTQPVLSLNYGGPVLTITSINNTWSYEATFTLQIATTGTSSIDDCLDCMEDVLAALGTDETFSGTVSGITSIEIGTIETNQQTNLQISQASITVNFIYQTPLWEM